MNGSASVSVSRTGDSGEGREGHGCYLKYMNIKVYIAGWHDYGCNSF